jgi:hypothetical protein
MLIAAEGLFILLLVIILFMVFNLDGFSARGRRRAASVKEYWCGKDRREHPRFTQSLEVSYSVIKGQVITNAGGKTVDISEGGAKLLLDEKLPQGMRVSLKISIPTARHMVEMTGDVMWTEDALDIQDPSGKRFFYSGIKFSTAQESSGNPLGSFIRSLTPRIKK